MLFFAHINIEQNPYPLPEPHTVADMLLQRLLTLQNDMRLPPVQWTDTKRTLDVIVNYRITVGGVS